MAKHQIPLSRGLFYLNSKHKMNELTCKKAQAGVTTYEVHDVAHDYANSPFPAYFKGGKKQCSVQRYKELLNQACFAVYDKT